MKTAAIVVALLTIVVGVLGLVSPESGTTARRLYFSTPVGFLTAAVVRMVMGGVLILFAPRSRTPRTLRALGALMCLQAVSATLLGPERAREVLEWEATHPVLLRAGAVIAAAAGGFLVFSITTATHRRHAH
jgi:peptidoglycan/LPS O-acetylase OafA/YrhL